MFSLFVLVPFFLKILVKIIFYMSNHIVKITKFSITNFCKLFFFKYKNKKARIFSGPNILTKIILKQYLMYHFAT